MGSLMDQANLWLSKPKEFKLQTELKIQHWNQFQGHKLHPRPQTAQISQVQQVVAQQRNVTRTGRFDTGNTSIRVNFGTINQSLSKFATLF